ncbi:MAG: CoA transferase [Candidatus Binatia bacterium]|nr:CoA transferase [Candidatus Binatia bacterium]
MTRTGPLVGLRVLDFTRGRAGALTGMLLADYGAEVLRIEPPGGDPLWDELPGYPVWHRGKEIVEIDLALPSAREAIAKRLPVADVMIESLRPGVLDAAGLGFDSIEAMAPRLIYASISGFGPAGADAKVPGYEALVQARLGLPSYQGAPHGRPAICTYPAGSFGAGLLAVIGILAALHQRERTGRGQRVETSLVDGVLAQLVMTLIQPVGEEVSVPPVSGGVPTLTIYRCGDGGYLQIHLGARGALDRLFEATGLRADDFVHADTGRHFTGDPAGGERFRAALAEVLATRSRDEWVQRFTDADVPIAACLAPGEALDHPQTAALEMTTELRDPLLGPITSVAPPIRFDGSPGGLPGAALQRGMPRNPEAALRHTGWLTAEEVAAAEQPRLGEQHGDAEAAAVSAESPAGPTDATTEIAPLDDLRVLDFGMFAAGPYAAMLLGELGADVIKIEPPGGDTMRPNARPFSGLHRGKRGLALNLKSPSAGPIVAKLVGGADVLLHNFRPGVAERLGLGWDAQSAKRPSLIHFHSTGYGTSGPMAALPGFDQIYQAVCGMSVAQGGEGQAPEQVAGAPLDCLNALLTTAGVLMALHHRDRTGEGQHAECAQLAAGLFALSEVYRTANGISDAGRLDHDRRALGDGYRIVAAQDGWLFVCCGDEEARDRLRALPREGEVIDWAAHSVEHWITTLAAADIAASRVRDTFDGSLLEDPLLVDAARVVEVQDPALGPVRQAGRFVRFSDAVLPEPSGGPGLGQHSREILRELGIEEEETSRLVADGVVGERGGA